MSKFDFWQTILYFLPILSYVIGRRRNTLRVPKPIQVLLENRDVIEIIVRGVEAAEAMKDKSDDEKREYVRGWAKSELYKVLGDWLPDSAINFLIEQVIVKRKTR